MSCILDISCKSTKVFTEDFLTMVPSGDPMDTCPYQILPRSTPRKPSKLLCVLVFFVFFFLEVTGSLVLGVDELCTVPGIFGC